MSIAPDSVPSLPAAGLISRSHLGIEPFELRRTSSLAETASAVAAGAWAYAGGVDITQRLRGGESVQALMPLCSPGRSPSSGLEQLDEISVRGGVLFVGAAVTHARMEADALVRTHRPDLAAAWLTIGNIRIRAIGTVGGNLMQFNTLNDAEPILSAANAVLVFAGADGSLHRCAVGDRPKDRLVVGCEVPLDGRVVYDRSHKPMASVAVGDHHVSVGCAYPKIETFSLDIADLDSPDAVGAALDRLGPPLDDSTASAAYRRRIIEVLIQRSIRAHRAGEATAPKITALAATASGAPEPGAPTPGAPAPQAPVSADRDPGEDSTDTRLQPDGADRSTRISTGTSTDVPTDTSTGIHLRLNGDPFTATMPASEMLVHTIRTRAGLGGTRVGCDQAVCGACTVLIDGTPAASCSTLSWQADGRDVLTIEAAATPAAAAAPDTAAAYDASGDSLDGSRDSDRDLASVMPVVQQAFADTSALQCGYCTPGMILTASALIARHREPDRATICDWLNSNLCRCTGYLMIIEAVEAAAAAMRTRDATGVATDGTGRAGSTRDSRDTARTGGVS